MNESRVDRFVDSLRQRQESAAGERTAHPTQQPTVPPPHNLTPSDPAALLDTDTLAKIGKLDLIAKSVVDGVMSGKHRSTHKGGCSEFSEHRPYSDGDDIRLLDWRIYARRDRYYVKQFEDETNLQAWIVMDCSGSMAFGHATVSKFEYARMACACLARLLLRQRDSIGLCLQVGQQWQIVPPRPQANHFLSLCSTLQQASPSGKTNVSAQLQRITPRLKRRGMILIFSDCFGNVAELAAAIEQLRVRGHEVNVFQVLAPEEISFNFRQTAIFEDLELPGKRLNVSPGVIRRGYLDRFGRFMDELKAALLRIDCDLVTLTTEKNLGDLLVYYLRKRAASRRTSPASA